MAEESALAFHVHLEDVLLKRVLLVGGVEDGFLYLIETEYFDDFKCAVCELFEAVAVCAVEVEVVVSVLACLVDELGVVPWQELDGCMGLEVFVVALGEECTELFACGGIVFIKRTVVLVAVEAELELRHFVGSWSCTQQFRQ